MEALARNPLRPLFLRGLLIALTVAIAIPESTAAQTLSAASIEGVVTDQTGGAMPGVTVTAMSTALQVREVTQVTDAEGRYRFPDLPRGEYQLRFELQGFKPVLRSGLTLTAGFNMRVSAALEVGGMEEVITVTGDAAIVDMTSTRGGQTISTEQLTTVLPGNKTVADLVNMTAGLRNTAGENAAVLGQNARPRFDMYGIASGNTNVTMMIDGFSVIANNPVPDVGATAEVDVKTFGNTADIKEVGVAMNMVLKSGGNTFRGSVSGSNLQQPDTNVTDYLKSRKLAVGSEVKYFNDYGGDLGGYFVPDKLWFFVSGRYRSNKISQPGLAANAGPDGIYLTGDEPPAYPKSNSYNVTAKFSYQINPKYSANFAITEDKNGADAELQGQDYVFVPYDSTGVMDWQPRTMKVEFKGTPTNQSVFSTTFGKSGYHIYRTYQPSCDLQPSSFDSATQLYDGCRFNQYGDSNFNFWVADTSYSYLPTEEHFGAKHEFKMGWHYSQRNNRDVRPSSPAGDYHLVFDTISGVPHQASQIQMNNAPTSPVDWDVVNSLFLLDQFRVGSRLTFNVGLRYERQHSYVPDQCKEPGSFPWVVEQCYDSKEVGTWNYWAPRTAVAWDVTGRGRSVLKVAYGYFVPESSLASNYNAVDGYDNTYRWHDLNSNQDYDPGEVNFDPNGGDILTNGSPTLNEINPDLELSYIREFTTTIEQSITPTSAVRFLYLYRRYGNQNANSNIARPIEAWDVVLNRRDPGPDGVLNNADDGGTEQIY